MKKVGTKAFLKTYTPSNATFVDRQRKPLVIAVVGKKKRTFDTIVKMY